MVIIIGTNDDGVHYWRYEVHRHWRQWIAISTIFVAIVMTLLPNYLINYQLVISYSSANAELIKKYMQCFKKLCHYGFIVTFLLLFGFICFSLGSSGVRVPCAVSLRNCTA